MKTSITQHLMFDIDLKKTSRQLTNQEIINSIKSIYVGIIFVFP